MEKVIRRFKPTVRRKVATEIRAHCCNLWNGDKCLLRDNGVEHRCPQLDADSITCLHFRDAVLPGNPVLMAEVAGEDTSKTCAVCGEVFESLSNRAKYCPRCAKRVSREQATKRKQKQRGLVTL